MITTVFLDIDNTLLDFDLCAKQSMQESAKEFNIEYTDALFETFKVINTDLWRRIEKGTLTREELKKAISESIKSKKDNLVGNMASQGTTPRQLTDLIGSLCDLTSGSGDKGTPVVLVQGYFDNYTN